MSPKLFADALYGWLQAIPSWIAVVPTAACFFISIALTTAGSSRDSLTIAFLEFENETGDPDLGHWRHTASKLIMDQLSRVKSVRVLPLESNEHGFHQLKMRAEDPIDSTKARKIGEIIEGSASPSGAALIGRKAIGN